MCGICGIIEAPGRSVNPDLLKRMNDVQIHRGPDDEGFYINERIGFGFRRLSIIDLHTGHQPLCNEDESIWIIFNGEIYNFQKLKNFLIQKGHSFRTLTDTEMIVHLYEEKGEELVNELEGMFAFVLFDKKNNKIFGARDRFGKKPFYYSSTNGRFLFSSEIKSLLTDASVSRDISPAMVDHFLTYGYTSNNESVYAAIKKLPAGHRISIDLSSNVIKIDRYWDIDFHKDYVKSKEEWLHAIDVSFTEAVKKRLISDVPLGAFLSGGLDSSAVVAKMALLSSERVKTFTIGFPEPEYDETGYAKLVAERYNTDHHVQVLTPDILESADIIEKMVAIYDEPFADSSAIPTYYLSKFTRQHVTVALSGDGGDELFAGYNSYRKLRRIIEEGQKTFSLPRQIFTALFALYSIEWRGYATILQKSLPPEHLGAYYTLWDAKTRNTLYTREFSKSLLQYGEKEKVALLDSYTEKELISRFQRLDIKTYMVDDILVKVDRASMANSLEVRCPVLDHSFAELVAKIPLSYLIQGNSGKAIFREYLTPYLPEQILNPRKKGFGIPLSKWFKGSLFDFMRSSFEAANNPLFAIIDKQALMKIVEKQKTSKVDFGSKLWSLLILNEWLKSRK